VLGEASTAGEAGAHTVTVAAEQGYEMQRPSLVMTELDLTGVARGSVNEIAAIRVGGMATKRAMGTARFQGVGINLQCSAKYA
jgi:hypothetical protein